MSGREKVEEEEEKEEEKGEGGVLCSVIFLLCNIFVVNGYFIGNLC